MRKQLIILIMVIAFLLIGCGNPFQVNKKEKTTDVIVPEVVELGKAEELLEDYILMLSGKDSRALNSAIKGVNTETLKESIKQKITTLDLSNSDDMGILIPLFIETTQESFSTQTSSEYVIDDIKTITEVTTNLVTVYKTKEYFVKDGIYTSITKTVIENLKTTELSAEQITSVSGAVVSTVVSNIDTTIVKPKSVGSKIQDLTKGASEAMIEAYDSTTLTEKEKITKITEAISVVATSAVASIDNIQKFEIQDDLRNQVYGDAAAGATEAIKLINSEKNLSDVQIKTMIKTITAEVTTEIINLDTGDAESKIMSMTNKTTEVAVTIDEDKAQEYSTAIMTQAITRTKESEDKGYQYGSDFYKDIVINNAEVLTSNGVPALNEEEFIALQREINSIVPIVIKIDYAEFANKKPIASLKPIQIINIDKTNTSDVIQLTKVSSLIFDGTDSYDEDFVDGDVLTYSWRIYGPDGVESDLVETKNILTLPLPSVSGDYLISLSVTDHFGKTGNISLGFYVHPEVIIDQSIGLVEEAMQAMKTDEWTVAYNKLDEAVEANPDNQEALLWWSTLSIANIMVSPEIQDVMNNLGFETYPDNLKDFVKGSYTEEVLSWDENEAGFTVDETDPSIVYISIINNNNITKLPKVSIPADIQEKFAQDNGLVNINQYMIAILYHAQQNYPDGFNNIIDAIVSATDVLDEITRKIDNIEPSIVLSLTYDMFSNKTYTPVKDSWPQDENDGPMVMNVGKAEFLASAAVLEFIQSMLYMVKSVSFEVDFDNYWTMFNPIDGKAIKFKTDGTPIWIDKDFDFSQVTNPLSTTALRAREDAGDSIDSSKKYILSSLNHLKESADLIVDRDMSSAYYLSQKNLSPYWNVITKGNQTGQIILDKLIDTISEPDQPFYIPMEKMSNPLEILEMTNISDWPNEKDKGDSINLFGLFNAESPILSLENIIEMRIDTEPQFYKADGKNYSKVVTIDDFSSIVNSNGQFYIRLPNVTKDIVNFKKLNSKLTGKDLYIPVGKDLIEGIGHSIFTKGSEFTYIDSGFSITTESFGSIWEFYLKTATGVPEIDYDWDYYGDYNYDNSNFFISSKIYLNSSQKNFVLKAKENQLIKQYNYKIIKNTYEDGYDGYNSEPLSTETVLEGSNYNNDNTITELTITAPGVLMSEDNIQYHLEINLIDVNNKIHDYETRFYLTDEIELETPQFVTRGEEYTVKIKNPRVDWSYVINSNGEIFNFDVNGEVKLTEPVDASDTVSSYSKHLNISAYLVGSSEKEHSYTHNSYVGISGGNYYAKISNRYYENEKLTTTDEVNISDSYTYSWTVSKYNDDDTYDFVSTISGREITLPEEISNYYVTLEISDGDTVILRTSETFDEWDILSHYLKYSVPDTITVGESLTITVPLPGDDSNIGSLWTVRGNSWDDSIKVSNNNSITLDATDTEDKTSIRLEFECENNYHRYSSSKYINIIK